MMPYGDVRDSDFLCPVADPRLAEKRATIQYGINYALAAESCHNANGKITNWGATKARPTRGNIFLNNFKWSVSHE